MGFCQHPLLSTGGLHSRIFFFWGGGGSVLRWTVAGQKYGPQGLRNSIMGAFIIRIGFWAHYAIIIVRNPQSGIGNHGGPYITAP